MNFKLISPFSPTGDQPQAIEKLSAGISSGQKYQTLLGVTGSGKTFTMANVITKTQKPTLIISHNKTLAAQLYQEFKDFLPENSVHYFVSYYDYYQPEAYMPTTDTYIEKDAKVNEQLDRLRHETTQAILSRRDVVAVASVSCIYNIGSPVNYEKMSLDISIGQDIAPKKLASHLVKLQYTRNDIEKLPGTFNQKGEAMEIYPSSGNEFYQIEFSLKGDRIENIFLVTNSANSKDGVSHNQNPPSPAAGGSYALGEKSVRQLADGTNLFRLREFVRNSISTARIFPAKFWISPQDQINLAMANIKKELSEQLKKLKSEGKILEHERLSQRVNLDLEMLAQAGYCYGIENYSSHLEFREPGLPPFTLIDYFKHAYGDDFLIIIDESHMTIPQIRAMHAGDKSRKQTLVDYGFRLPSALDNRPLKFTEFENKNTQTVFVSATPSEYELLSSGKENVVEQLIRPTGLLDPEIEVRPTKNQIPDLIKELRLRVATPHPLGIAQSANSLLSPKGEGKQKAFVTVLTKRLAEEMAEYLADNDLKAYYLHSEIKTLERTEILRDLRLGKYDIIVGVNLLREGLDIPEVSFIAIMDADKEGFLRNKTTLIQTIGRAARNLEGKVIMYADKMTRSMKEAIEETNRRRKTQEEYNKEHGLKPQQIIKPIRDLIINRQVSEQKEKLDKQIAEMISDEGMLEDLISQAPQQAIKTLEKEMKKAASQMNFELAARLRDKIKEMKKWI